MESIKKEWKIFKSAFKPDEKKKKEEAEKKRAAAKKKKKRSDESRSSDDSSINSKDMELAADITADVFTGGLYGTATGVIEAADGIEEYQKYRAEELKKMEQEEKSKKNEASAKP